jgi:His Kinase A (phosphoacceptor) domain.
MVAGVAHEINNPISFIYGNINPAARYAHDLVEILQLYQQYYPEPFPEIADKLAESDADFIAEDFPKILASMEEGANRIKQIVLSLRNFSRLDEKALKISRHSSRDRKHFSDFAAPIEGTAKTWGNFNY